MIGTMNATFSLHPKVVHLWRVWLPDLSTQEAELTQILSPDELARAARFRFPIHKQRFIIARGVLRQLLSLYMKKPAAEIKFSYGSKGKPFLLENIERLQFNVSHSHDIALYAFTVEHDIGVDIEKIEKEYKDAVAKRFFSEREYADLNQLPVEQRQNAFYQLWAAKEALIKALGEGLYIGLDEFSISIFKTIQEIEFAKKNFHIENFIVHPEYRSAFATTQEIENIIYYEWKLSGPMLSESLPII